MGGATFAFFTSTATSTANAFSSGTLILQVNDNNETAAASVTASFNTGNTGLKPGDTTSGFISLDNTGSINIDHITLAVSQTANSTPSLADVLNVTAAGLSTSSSCTSPTDLLAGWQAQSGLSGPTTLTKLITKGEFNAVPGGLTAGATKYLCMTFTMDSNATNTYQGATTTDTFSFIGKQDASQLP